MLASLVLLVIWLVVLAVVFGVLRWALATMWPQAPPVIHTGLLVLAVLVGLYLVLVYLGGVPFPALPRT